MAELHLHRAGPLTTIQDGGRRGFQHQGVSGVGPMDRWAHVVANRLVGNPDGAGGLELALGGLELEVTGGAVRLAFAGGDFALKLDDRPVSWWSTSTLRPGQKLTIGRAIEGAWGYVAVLGGLAIPPALGSQSTHQLSGLGGIDGRRLHDGAVLPLVMDEVPPRPDLALERPPAIHAERIRVVLGPQDDYFTAAGIETLLGAEWRVSGQTDRMGYRLVGPCIEHAKTANIVSDGILMGSIQVPGMGTPIVLMADRQTTGGYPKIATVISADMGYLAQTRSGEALRFEAIEFGAALATRRQRWRQLERSMASLAPLGPAARTSSERLLGLNLIGGVTAGEHREDG